GLRRVEGARPAARNRGRLGLARGVPQGNRKVDVAAIRHEADVAVAAGLGGRRALLAAAATGPPPAAAAGAALAAALARRRPVADLDLVAVVEAEVVLEDLRFFRLGRFLRRRRAALLGRRHFAQLQIGLAAQAQRAGQLVDVLGAVAQSAPVAEGAHLLVLRQLLDFVRRQLQDAGGLFQRVVLCHDSTCVWRKESADQKGSVGPDGPRSRERVERVILLSQPIHTFL